MLFDSTAPGAWDPNAHQQHLVLHTLSLACGYCVRAAAHAPSPGTEVIELAFQAILEASQVQLDWVEQRCRSDEQRSWVRQWPGEHYRLLSGFVRALQPSLVVEVGTFTGMGTLALLDGAAQPAPGGADGANSAEAPAGGGSVVTYDVIGWDSFEHTLLREQDFGPGRAEQRLGDLADDAYFATQSETLLSAELIFVDGPKDGRFEPVFFSRLFKLLQGSRHVVVLDDIHFLNMVNLWKALGPEKLDLTSFGHWSGTGMVLTN